MLLDPLQENLDSLSPALQSTSIGEQLGVLFSCEDKKAYYRKGYIAWERLERAKPSGKVTKKTKYLSPKAQDILAVVMQKLKKSEKVFFKHKYLSMITGCDRKQNKRIIGQLDNVLEITYHNSVIYGKRKYRFVYEFRHKVQIQKETDYSSSIQETAGESEELKKESTGTFLTPSYIHNKNNYLKDRSMCGSNFSESFKKSDLQINSKPPQEEAKEKSTVQNQSEPTIPSKKQGKFKKPKTLADFYPLTKEDCVQFQISCGRDFDLNAMNEILLSMSRKNLKASFYHKNGFMAYMTKAYLHELRDAVKISNGTYKIKSNLSEEEKKEEEIEKYLNEIENSKQVSQEEHLKKKLASTLKKSTSYALLKAYNRIVIEDHTAKLILHEAVDLTPMQYETVLKEIKATHEWYEGKENGYIDKVEFIVSKPQSKAPTTNKQAEIPNNLWGTMRRQLISIYGPEIDGHWFAKFDVKVDEEKKTIDLKDLKPFFKDWVKNNYQHTMERIASEMGVQILV